MRIWDIDPGYLNRQSLLGEHRELHGIVSILTKGKKGYARHPETLRWVGYGWALRQRHQLLAAEMALRGYCDKTPVTTCERKDQWPKSYIDQPGRQVKILADKYRQKEQGRIPLPKTAQQLWSQHKYSLLARDVNLYKKLGPEIAKMKPDDDFSALVKLFTEQLRNCPSAGGLRNALQHMWGYVSELPAVNKGAVETWSLSRLLQEIQQRTLRQQQPYLLASTALSELRVWLLEPAPDIRPPGKEQ